MLMALAITTPLAWLMAEPVVVMVPVPAAALLPSRSVPSLTVVPPE